MRLETIDDVQFVTEWKTLYFDPCEKLGCRLKAEYSPNTRLNIYTHLRIGEEVSEARRIATEEEIAAKPTFFYWMDELRAWMQSLHAYEDAE